MLGRRRAAGQCADRRQQLTKEIGRGSGHASKLTLDRPRQA
jgi:hypothetical protein